MKIKDLKKIINDLPDEAIISMGTHRMRYIVDDILVSKNEREVVFSDRGYKKIWEALNK